MLFFNPKNGYFFDDQCDKNIYDVLDSKPLKTLSDILKLVQTQYLSTPGKSQIQKFWDKKVPKLPENFPKHFQKKILEKKVIPTFLKNFTEKKVFFLFEFGAKPETPFLSRLFNL